VNQELKIENPQSEIRNSQSVKRSPLYADEPKTLAELFIIAVLRIERLSSKV